MRVASSIFVLFPSCFLTGADQGVGLSVREHIALSLEVFVFLKRYELTERIG